MSCDCHSGECYVEPFSQFVQQSWEIIGSPDNYSLAQISGYYLSPSNLNKLNIQIDSDYCVKALDYSGQITGFEFKPPLCGQPVPIYEKIFEVDYYNTLAAQVLRSSVGAGQGSIQQLKQDENTVVFQNKGVISAQIRGLAKDNLLELKDMVVNFLRFQVGAGQIIYSEDILGFQPWAYGPYGIGYAGYGGWYFGIVPYYGYARGYGA